MRRRSAIALLATTTVVAGALVIPAISLAADGTGVYGAWALSTDVTPPTGGTVTFTGTVFPEATFTSTDAVLSVARSATLTGSTPFGAQYGTSSGKTYLSSAIASGKSQGTLTLTFDTPPIAGTYGLAVGDVDAENLVITATDVFGDPLNVAEWGVETFNYAGGTDLPSWEATAGRIEGNVADTSGASAWLAPTQSVKTITITQERTSGFPQYQLWIAADVITPAPVPSPVASATSIPTAPAGKVVICHRTNSRNNPYIEATVSQDSIVRRNGHSTHTGGIFPEDDWGDIIPPFPGFDGLNWPAGAAILNNGCETGGENLITDTIDPLASPTPSPSGSASPSPTPTADTICTTVDTALINGSFEQPVIPAKSFRQIIDTDVPGWFTTATDRKIEIWSTGYNGVTAPVGNQFAEINATQAGELYQVVDTIPGQQLVWSLAHRARGAGATGDTMTVNIGPAVGSPNQRTTFTDVLTDGWVRHTGTYVVPAGQTQTRFGFQSGPTASGSATIGNFLDDIFFTTTECYTVASPAPLPSPTASPSVSTDPSVSVSPTPTTSASPSGTASPSATASPSGSASPSGTATASPSATASPTATATATPTATASPTAGPTPTPTATATSTPTATPTPTPSPSTVVVDPTTEPPVVPNDRPVIIEVNGTVTDVGDPGSGTAVVEDGNIVYTPEPGFIGEVEIPVTVIDRDGEPSRIVVTIQVGRDQTANVPLPSRLVLGRNVLLNQQVLTNARQPVTVTVACAPLDRATMGDMRLCVLRTEGGRTVLEVNAPARVTVTLSAPARGSFAAYSEVQRYTVR